MKNPRPHPSDQSHPRSACPPPPSTSYVPSGDDPQVCGSVRDNVSLGLCVLGFRDFDESLKFRTTLRITQSEAQSPFKSSHLNRHRSSSGGIDGAIDDARDIFSYVISLSTRYHVIITETWARASNKGNSGKVT